jgi:hypothetical protein
VRLADAGIPDEVIVDLIRIRGIVARPSESGAALLGEQGVSPRVLATLQATRPTEQPTRSPSALVYRDFFIPFWPSYSGGHWHFGLRGACFFRSRAEGNDLEILQEEPEYVDPAPRTISP